MTEGSLIMGRYKLVKDIQTDGYSDQAYPDTPIISVPPCPKDGCLFDIEADPYEHHDLSDKLPDIKQQLQARLKVGMGEVAHDEISG